MAKGSNGKVHQELSAIFRKKKKTNQKNSFKVSLASKKTNQQKEFKQGLSYDCNPCLHFYLFTDVVNGKQNWSLIYSFFFFQTVRSAKITFAFS